MLNISYFIVQITSRSPYAKSLTPLNKEPFDHRKNYFSMKGVIMAVNFKDHKKV